MNQQSQYSPQTLQGPISVGANGLHPVRTSPLDERIGCIGGSIASLESEIEHMRNQLGPISLPSPKADGSNTMPAAPAPAECAIEQALRGYDARITAAWQTLSALRAQLRV
jgi:hypothetical protein